MQSRNAIEMSSKYLEQSLPILPHLTCRRVNTPNALLGWLFKRHELQVLKLLNRDLRGLPERHANMEIACFVTASWNCNEMNWRQKWRWVAGPPCEDAPMVLRDRLFFETSRKTWIGAQDITALPPQIVTRKR